MPFLVVEVVSAAGGIIVGEVVVVVDTDRFLSSSPPPCSENSFAVNFPRNTILDLADGDEAVYSCSVHSTWSLMTLLVDLSIGPIVSSHLLCL